MDGSNRSLAVFCLEDKFLWGVDGNGGHRFAKPDCYVESFEHAGSTRQIIFLGME